MNTLDVTKPYDPTWVVKLAREQYPNIPQLAEKLSQCTQIIVFQEILNIDEDYALNFLPRNLDYNRGDGVVMETETDTIIIDMYAEYDIIQIEVLKNYRLSRARGIIINA
jgi:hypothetical protein